MLVLCLVFLLAGICIWGDSYRTAHLFRRSFVHVKGRSIETRKLTLLIASGSIELNERYAILAPSLWGISSRNPRVAERQSQMFDRQWTEQKKFVITQVAEDNAAVPFHSSGPADEAPLSAPLPGERLGMGFSRVQARGGAEVTTDLIIPMWAATLLVAFAGATLYWLDRRRRPRPGFCAACGYDIRATPERCPECGNHAAVKMVG